MSKRISKPALGRGLNALIRDHELEDIQEGRVNSISSLPLAQVIPNPDQPRREFDEASIAELADSIRSIGLVQPITVQKLAEGKYQIISGERRYRASKHIGADSIPAYVLQAKPSEVLEMALVENIQREDLNAIEIALAYQGLLEHGKLTQEALANRVGKKRATISNYLRLLRLPAEIQLGISQKLLEMGHARALLQVTDAKRQIELYQMIISEQLSVREVEEIARAIQEHRETDPSSDAPIAKPSPQQSKEFKELEHHLTKVLGARVTLKHSSNGKGSIRIPYSGEEELERIILLLQRIQK